MVKDGPDKKRGERIRFVRTKLLEMRSQTAFAEWLEDVTRGAVGNWERGEPISLDNLSTIAQKAGVPFEWLAFGKGPAPKPGEHKPPSRVEVALAMYDDLPPAERVEFLQRALSRAAGAQTSPDHEAPRETGEKPPR